MPQTIDSCACWGRHPVCHQAQEDALGAHVAGPNKNPELSPGTSPQASKTYALEVVKHLVLWLFPPLEQSNYAEFVEEM